MSSEIQRFRNADKMILHVRIEWFCIYMSNIRQYRFVLSDWIDRLPGARFTNTD